MIARELASRIIAISYDGLPADALSLAKSAILDTVGVTLAGADAECTRVVEASSDSASTSGSSLVFGRRYRTSSLTATLVNGTASHALDYDDCNNTMGGHPSAPILPALWALSEETGASGRDLITAYVAGVEAETKIGRAVNFHHYEKGWHPTATLGTFGSAAASAHLSHLSIDETATALALAASMAAGIKANFGTMTKPFHVGQCARNGLLATRLAKEGMTASPEVFEHPQGFFEVFNGPGNYDAARLFETWGAPLDIIDPGIAFKQYPCCASTHSAIDAILTICREHGLKGDQIASITSWTHPRRLRHTNRPNPKSGLDAKFSVQYCLARAALDGNVRLNHFEDVVINDPGVREMMSRITAEPHPESKMDTSEHFFADVTVKTREGESFRAFVDRPAGRDRDHPLPEGTLERKFEDCASKKLDAGAVEAVRKSILDLESASRISDISELILQGTSVFEDVAMNGQGETRAAHVVAG